MTNTRHLVLFYDGTNAVMSNSSDGATWSAKTTVHATIIGNLGVALHCDTSGNFYYVAITSSAVFFRKGSLNSANGATTWAAAEQTVASTLTTPQWPSINLDSGSHPIISWSDATVGNNGTKVALDANTDGTWSNAAGFPKQIDPHRQYASVVGQTSLKFYVVWGLKQNATIFGVQYNSGFGSTVTVSTNASISVDRIFTVVASGDIVHMTYVMSGGNGIKYCVFSSSWTCQATIAVVANACALVDITLNSTLECIWNGWNGSGNNPNSVFNYRRRNSDGASGSWETGNQTWFIDPQAMNSNNEKFFSVSYQDYNNEISLAFWSQTAQPWNLRYNFMLTSVNQPVTLTVSPTGPAAATFAISGCSASPNTILGDGSSHTIVVVPSCSLTFTVPADTATTAYRFTAGAQTWSPAQTCGGGSGTCSAQTNTYYYLLNSISFAYTDTNGATQIPNTVTIQASNGTSFNNPSNGLWWTYGTTTLTACQYVATGCQPSPNPTGSITAASSAITFPQLVPPVPPSGGGGGNNPPPVVYTSVQSATSYQSFTQVQALNQTLATNPPTTTPYGLSQNQMIGLGLLGLVALIVYSRRKKGGFESLL